jgi:hypothetical protein
VVVLTRGDAMPPAGHAPPGPDRARGTIRFCRWNGRSGGTWEQELARATVLINLAGRSVNCRYTPANQRAIMDSRILPTRALQEALARCPDPPALWLNSSTATIYRHTFGHAWDEDGQIGATAEAHDAFSIQVATAWESEFFREPAPATRKVALRSAIVLSRDAQNIATILRRLVLCGLGGPMAGGGQWVSWVHIEDFCRAIAFLINNSSTLQITGPVNIASPQPVTNDQMMRIFRQAIGRRRGLPASRWMLELGAFFLRTETELICKSRRVIPGRLTRAGFAFSYPAMRGAIENLIGGCGHPRQHACTGALTPSSSE